MPRPPSPDQPTEREIRAEQLLRTAQRQSSAALGGIVGAALVLAATWNGPMRVGGVLMAFARVLTVWQTFAWGRAVQRIGGVEAFERGMERRLMAIVCCTGLSWGAVTWLFDPHATWEPRQVLLVLLVVAAAIFMLLTTAWLRSTMLAFNVGFGLTVIPRFAMYPEDGSPLLLGGILALFVTLAAYGRQLLAQSRETVLADLQNRRLAAELATTNAELRAALDAANRLARHDPLTGALNRRAFFDRVRHEAAAMARHADTACVVLIDLDHFKHINDRHGHSVGDQVLAQLSRTIQRGLRQHDVLARWGGEEFMLLLPRTALSAGAEAAERLRRELAAARDPAWPEGLAVRISAGVAAWPAGTSIDDAIEAADRALYAAKAAGRDRIEVARGEAHSPLSTAS